VERTAADWRSYRYRDWLRKILAAIVPPLIVALIQWHFKPTMARWALFYPAVFLSAWFGGAVSGIAATIGSCAIVWWAFMPPHFEFNPLSAAEYDSFAVFVLISSLIICFSHLFREALDLTRK